VARKPETTGSADADATTGIDADTPTSDGSHTFSFDTKPRHEPERYIF
jgi:hypothetical protein